MLLIFDVLDGNPNGDPDAANQPRQDLQTNQGIVTDVSIKRKVRDTIPLLASDPERYGIFVEAGEPLNPRLEESYTVHGFALETADDTGGAKKARRRIDPGQADQARAWLCNRYFDIRMFGGVIGTGNTQSLGKLRGPLQVTFGRSVEPVAPELHAITRVAKTRESETGHGEMGNKWTVPYGLYTARLHYSAIRGQQTGVTAQDLDLLYKVLVMMWDHTSSTSRGEMSTRGLYVFSHPNAFGVVPAHKLIERVSISRAASGNNGAAAPDQPARAFTDYTIDVDDDGLPEGVGLAQLA